METIQIKKLSDCPNGQQDGARIFADGYYNDLKRLSEDRQVLQKAFEGAFLEEKCYLAYLDGEAVGLAACVDHTARSIQLERQKFVDAFGWLKGSFYFWVMRKEFHPPLPYPEYTGYIETVATSESARQKGVATALIQYFINELPYRDFILEVTDTNKGARLLYEKLGFTEFQRKQERFSKKSKGFSERIYMKHLSAEEEEIAKHAENTKNKTFAQLYT